MSERGGGVTSGRGSGRTVGGATEGRPDWFGGEINKRKQAQRQKISLATVENQIVANLMQQKLTGGFDGVI